MPLVKVKDLRKYFPIKTGLLRRATSFVHAVDGISFEIEKGETFGLVGESGCGKTTVGMCLLRLIEPTAGKIYFNGQDIITADKKELKTLRKKMQIVFQNPYTSLNPRKTVRQILSDSFELAGIKESEVESEALKLLKKVALSEEQIDRYPYEFSGGQRQRIAFARSIAVEPVFIFLDEPTSSLDVSVQAKMLNLLSDLRNELNLTLLFVSHNIDVVTYMSSKIAVMYAGKILELASTEEILNRPMHPYTQALFSAKPNIDPTEHTNRIHLAGEVASPIDPPPSCRFYKRCWLAKKGLCDKREPPLLDKGNGHFVACHLLTDR
jgi:oligopeptide/dipeptide ABC transporter ATP-binding protein